MSVRDPDDPPDHEFHPGDTPRQVTDPRTDPSAGLEYGSLEREDSAASRTRMAVGIVLLVAVAILLWIVLG
jgi:hypothetical protein